MVAEQATRGEHVDFGTGEGYLFLPERTEPTGAVIILHERYGLVKHTLDLAQKLADSGLVGFAPDLFSRWQGDKAALTRGDVRVTLPDAEVGATVEACVDFLKAHPRVQADRIAVMGVCQSGRYAIVAGHRPDLAALVVFYGAAQESDWEVTDLQPIPMPEMIGRLVSPTLFVFGEADHVISLSDVQRVRQVMEERRKSYRIKVFPGMPHGWLNDTMPGRYRPKEAEEAWQMLLAYLDQAFERRWPARGRVAWELQAEISPDYDFSRNVRLE